MTYAIEVLVAACVLAGLLLIASDWWMDLATVSSLFSRPVLP